MLQDCLDKIVSAGMKVLHIGNGSSDLPEQMCSHYPTITQLATDVSSIVVEQMQRRCQQIDNCEFEVMDATCMESTEDGEYDLVIEKGTFDAMRTAGQGAIGALQMLSECHRVLKPGIGILLLISSQNREHELASCRFDLVVEEVMLVSRLRYCRIPPQTYFAHHCMHAKSDSI